MPRRLDEIIRESRLKRVNLSEEIREDIADLKKKEKEIQKQLDFLNTQ